MSSSAHNPEMCGYCPHPLHEGEICEAQVLHDDEWEEGTEDCGCLMGLPQERNTYD